eukprot:Colp12_sorted_trinity150504_noHs@36453
MVAPTLNNGRVELGELTVHNIKQLRVLNTTLFPVPYNEKFYKDVLEVGEYARLAYFNDVVVGAVCCRFDPDEQGHGKRKCYIMTLGCLAPYRRRGVGTQMLKHILDLCKKAHDISSVYLHVQTSNQDALEFYKKHNFTVVETAKDYYKNIEPADAHVLEYRVSHCQCPH